jgi:hypothetical protein
MADIINIPNNLVPPPVIPLTDAEKNRIVLTLQGNSLKNPTEPALSSLIEETIRQRDLWQTSGVELDPISEADREEMRRALNFLRSALEGYRTHSNIISGVNYNYNGFPPGFLGRLSIAQSYNNLRESIRKTADGPCGIEEPKENILNAVFRSILGTAQSLIEELTPVVTNLKERAEEATDPQAVYDEFQPIIDSAYQRVLDLKTEDDRGYFRAYNFVIQFSLGQSIVNSKRDPAANFLFENVVGGPLFNAPDETINALNVQCQAWFITSGQPDDDFGSRFSSEAAITNITAFQGISVSGLTVGDLIQWDGSNFVNIGVNDLGISGGSGGATDGYILTAKFEENTGITHSINFDDINNVTGKGRKMLFLEDDGMVRFDFCRAQDIFLDSEFVFSVESFTISGASAELIGVGNYSLTGRTFNASYPTNAADPSAASISASGTNTGFPFSLIDPYTSGSASGKTVAYPGAKNQSVTFTIGATSTEGEYDEATDTIVFRQNNYWGVSSNGALDGTGLIGLGSSALSTSRSRSFSVTAGSGEYIYYAYPTSYGLATFTVGGFAGGFSLLGTYSHTNANSFVENYYIYRSDNTNLGSTTVVVS